jgi:hypothetical protein
MPEPTKDTLKRIAVALRKAAGMEDAPPDKPAAAPATNGPNTQPPKPPGNKADAGPALNGGNSPKPVAGVASAGMNSGEPQ